MWFVMALLFYMQLLVLWGEQLVGLQCKSDWLVTGYFKFFAYRAFCIRIFYLNFLLYILTCGEMQLLFSTFRDFTESKLVSFEDRSIGL